MSHLHCTVIALYVALSPSFTAVTPLAHQLIRATHALNIWQDHTQVDMPKNTYVAC